MTNEGKFWGSRPPSGNRQPRSSERAGGGMKGKRSKPCGLTVFYAILAAGASFAVSWPVAVVVGMWLS